MSTKHNSLLFVVVLLLSLVFAPASHAALSAVGPVDPATTLPAWYQDATGLSLAPCFDNNGFCAVTMAAAPGFNPTLPLVFPTNFPEEGFYFYSEAFSDPDGTLFIAALEFAFAVGPVRAGDQVTFARIRMDNNNNNVAAGSYTITHPYGVDTVVVTPDNVAKNQGLRFTEDVGVAPGIFTGALQGRVGPFLQTATGLITSPDGNVYVGNGISPVAVTGTAVTSVTVAGPISGTTNLFTLEGKVIGLSVTPTTITFPAQRAAVNSAPVTVTVKNLSTVNTVAIGQVVSQGASAADFTIALDTCSNTTLAANGTCTFNVVFNGAAAGPVSRVGTMLIPSATPSAPPVFVAPISGIIDAVAPTVLSTFPVTANAPANTTISVSFSEPMLATSITSTTFTVLSGTTPVAGTVAFDAANNTATFTPTAQLTVGAVISVATSTSMTDAVGNPLGNPSSFSFTAQTPDTTPPSIAEISPANNATGVSTASVITVKFNEQMLGTSITADTIKVTSGGVAVEGTLTVANNEAANTAVVSFTPARPLEFGGAYTVTITIGALDLARNALGAQQVINFVANFQPLAPEVVSPANGATSLARPVVLRWKRSTDQDQDTIQYHLFLCNNQNFIGTAPNCLQNVTITPTTAAASDIYYAGIGSWGALLSLLGLGFAFGFKGRKKIFMLVAVLVVSGLFLVSCKKKSDNPVPVVSTDLTYSVADLSANVTYFWKVEADDSKGGVSATKVMTFTTQ